MDLLWLTLYLTDAANRTENANVWVSQFRDEPDIIVTSVQM